jgi:membrane fusion protein (multidrug efflux system)
VNGTVVAVYFADNQIVHAGDLIAELDARDYDVALAQARAQLAQAEAQLASERPGVPITDVTNQTNVSTTQEDVASAFAELESAERDAERARATVDQAEATARYAELEKQRAARLVASGAIAVSLSDQRASTADAASASLEAQRQAARASDEKVADQRARLLAARRRREEARQNAPRQLESRRALVAQREAAVEAARAQVEQAELNRSYARIIAPVDGIIGSKSVNVGDRVAPGQQLLAITQVHDVWVTANFRETQVEKMHPGQTAKIYVDALGLDFRGSVESMPGATGSRYSLLPPENATGNYVKVVQRLPVRIRIDPKQKGYERLRPGMSVEPKVSL